MEHNNKSEEVICGGGELTIAAMDENSYMEIGRKTYIFAKKLMRDPEMRKKIKERAAQIRASQKCKGEQNPTEL